MNFQKSTSLYGAMFAIVCAALPELAVAASNAKPPLPKVVLVGDSIADGYAPLVAKRLEGKAVIVTPPSSGGDSGIVLQNLEAWLAREKPAVVHLNCGLHDLK